MKNDTHNTKSVKFMRKAAPNLFKAVRLGYIDASKGKVFNSYYDTFSIVDQKNYEIGRLMFFESKALGINVIPWPEHIIFPRHLQSVPVGV